jgi:hypothetical protein
METYQEAMDRVLDKCREARDTLCSHIEIQERKDARDGFMLLRRHKHRGFIVIQDPGGDLREWAKAVVVKLIEMGKVEAEEAYPF